jgi:hypothetical protein
VNILGSHREIIIVSEVIALHVVCHSTLSQGEYIGKLVVGFEFWFDGWLVHDPLGSLVEDPRPRFLWVGVGCFVWVLNWA